MLIRSLARVIKGTNCHVFWCAATSCYLCMKRFSHDLNEPALFGASLQRKFPETQHVSGFSKSVRLSEHCSWTLDKQFPLFCFYLFISAAHSAINCLKVLVLGEIINSEKRPAVVVFSQNWPFLPSWQVHMTKPHARYHTRLFPAALLLNTDSTGDWLDTRSW